MSRDDRPEMSRDHASGVAVEREPTAESSASRPASLIGRYGLTPWDAAGVVVCGLLVLLFLPRLMFQAWTPRAVVLIGFAPVGLALMAVDRSRAALLGWTVIGWSIVSALLSPAPRSALLGFAGRDLSALVVVAAFGFWALGRRISSRGARALVDVLVWTTAFGAVVGLLQVVLDLERGSLALASGRPTGLLSNPVYFGALCSVGLVAATARWAHRPSNVLVAPMLALGIGTSLSGSRVALLAAIASLVAIALAGRNRPTSVATAISAGSLVAGVVVDRLAGAGRNAADRLAEGTGGGRTEVWRYGLDAWLERPIAGYGLGRFRPAVQDRFSVDFVRDHARDEVSQPWFDAHNVVIGMLVAVGIVGLVLMVAWAVVAARRAAGPLAWALVPIVLHWLLQPVSLFTLPLAMLLLGAAAPLQRVVEVRRRWLAATIVVGILLGGYLLAADVRLRRAVDAGDPAAAEAAASMLGADPIARDIVAQVYASQGDRDGTRSSVIEWRRKVADAEPDRPFWWSTLASQLVAVERFDEAEEALDRAIELQPNNTRTWNTVGRLAIARDDAPALQEALDRLCELGQEECGLDAVQLLEQGPRDP